MLIFSHGHKFEYQHSELINIFIIIIVKLKSLLNTSLFTQSRFNFDFILLNALFI